MFLNVDRYGRFYQPSRDRSDGSGYTRHATPVKRGDVSYGSNYLTHERQYKKDMRTNRRSIGEADDYQARLAAVKRFRAQEEQRKARIKSHLMRNPLIQRELIKRGLGCECPQAAGARLSGAMSRQQQTIRAIATGMGNDFSISISDTERKRQQHMEAAKKILQYEAARNHAQRHLEQSKEKEIERMQKRKAELLSGRHRGQPIGEYYRRQMGLLQPGQRRLPLRKAIAAHLTHPMQLLPRR